MLRKLAVGLALVVVSVVALAGTIWKGTDFGACVDIWTQGIVHTADSREDRFTGKRSEAATRCWGGEKPGAYAATPWLDWSNYWAAGDGGTKSQSSFEPATLIGEHLASNGRGVDGALTDIEYQRIELLKFNLHDNTGTYPEYANGRGGENGRTLKVWEQMRLPPGHPSHAAVGGDAAGQVCSGELTRFRTQDGICNDLFNPAMGSAGMPFARNVEFEETFPGPDSAWWVKNRHGDRIGALKPDPQLVSRRLLTRLQRDPAACANGKGEACDYLKAPFFNVIAAYWIQFMTHDWFSHLDEARGAPETMPMGCEGDAKAFGCRPDDAMERALFRETSAPSTYTAGGREHPSRAYKTTRNFNTAWWDASQIYGYGGRSDMRVKRDPADRAKLALETVPGLSGAGDSLGYLPVFTACAGGAAGCAPDAINPEWDGQEAAAFPDNWTIGLSFLHTVFTREHNLFVDGFRAKAKAAPDEDSGLRRPGAGETPVPYKSVSDDELFQIARLVVSAEIAKIHTVEWTPQLLYNEPLFAGMNANWYGLFRKKDILKQLFGDVVEALRNSDTEKGAVSWYTVFGAGSGIVGLGNSIGDSLYRVDNPRRVMQGVNHFGSPFNFPEEFVTVYKLHPLLPDVLELRDAKAPDAIAKRVPVVATFRREATAQMRREGLADWALSLGRQRLGRLTLNNHPAFLQNLDLGARLATPAHTIDLAALDLIRDRERGVPRFNEFRRQYGLKQLTSFDDFIDKRLSAKPDRSGDENAELARQDANTLALREVYGTHVCDKSKVISLSQTDPNGSRAEGRGDKLYPDDCLGHPDKSVVDNIEDVDAVAGWLAESTRPHGFAISETQFQVFILNASRRLYSDRFFTSSFGPEFYSRFGYDWVNDNGPEKAIEDRPVNGHEGEEMLPMKRVLMRTVPDLAEELSHVVNAFDPWARDRGEYYSLEWKARAGAEKDEAFAKP